MNEQNLHGEELFQKLSLDKKKRRRKVVITVVLVILAVVIALVVIMGMLRRNVEARFAQNYAEVLEYQVTPGTLHTVVAGSGVLMEEDLEQLSVPAGVEVTEVTVEAGDMIKQGDLIARVDIATVMTALSGIQERMKELDESIGDAKGDEVSSTITTGVTGRVKRIFAEKGMDVSSCMAEHGALAVLSLDGYMAVNIETDKLAAKDEVKVTRADGKVIDGKVESAAGGMATILVTDNGPVFDEEVTVSFDDTEIGKGKLYIHNPLAVTGYAGTISDVSAKENAKVSKGALLFRLKNTAFSANYDSLLRDRADMEEVLMELVTLYRDGALLAPMDGKISSVEFDQDEQTVSSATSVASAYAAYTGIATTTTTTTTTTSSNGETNVATLYPNRKMSITISIDETDILSLEEGQEAEVTVASVSQEETFPGTVTEISKVADTSTGVTRYSAEVLLDRIEGMLPGMTADVDVRIEGVENALIIPVDALHQTRDTYFVYTAYDQETNQYGGRVEVTIGMQNDTQVEILTGLSEGDTIYYTEAPQDIFSFMMGQMGGMSGMNGMSGMAGSGGMSGRPSGNFGPSGMGGR